MSVHKIFIPLVLLALAVSSCDDHDRSANAQDEPGASESMTVVTGALQAESEQGCPRLIDGLRAGDMITLEIEADGMKTGSAKLTNMATGTEADCEGDVDDTPPADISCTAKDSTIPGIKPGDMLDMSIAFSSQTREVSLANLSSADGITCGFLTLDTLNAM